MMSHLNGHMETHSNAKLACDMCPKLFTTSKTLSAHRRQVHTTDHQYLCNVCGKGFTFSTKFKVGVYFWNLTTWFDGLIN